MSVAMSFSKSPHESLGFLLHDAARAIRRRFELQAAELGISSAQWRCLVHLLREGPSPQARLAELLEIEPISVSRLLDRMEEAGWVIRAPALNDRRVRLVPPTTKPSDALAEAKKIADTIYDDALANLPAGTREMLMAALRQIIANLSHSPECKHED